MRQGVSLGDFLFVVNGKWKSSYVVVFFFFYSEDNNVNVQRKKRDKKKAIRKVKYDR